VGSFETAEKSAAVLNNGGKNPRYRALAEMLKQQIVSGKYLADSRIPSEHQIAARFNVSRVTARQAIQVVEHEGLVRRIRGSGTYVNRLGPENRPLAKLQRAALVRIDVPEAHGYYHKGIESAQRWLGERGGILSTLYLSTSELAGGALTCFLRTASDTQALLVDGIVTDESQADIIKRCGLPFLVVGNFPISRSVPQFRFAVSSMIRRGIELLSRERPDLPIALLADSKVYNYKREIIAAYRQFVRAASQGRPMFVEWGGDPDATLAHCARECIGQPTFSVITPERNLAPLEQFYETQKIAPRDRVILQMSSPEMVTPAERASRYFVPLSSERIMREAVRVLTEMVEGGSGAHYQELDAEIETPSKLN